MGDTLEATRAFHQVIREDVPRVPLIDTFHDEKFEAVRVARELNPVVDGHGAGGAMSAPPIVDSAPDSVEIDGEPAAVAGEEG